MARLIDLDQLMKYPLRRGIEHCDEKNADPRFLNGVESILEWAQTLPTLTPQSEWISADERLPDNKGEYLVAYHPCHWDFVSDGIRVGLDSFRGKTAWAKKKYQRVTHWMPLPEPPDSRPPEGEEDT